MDIEKLDATELRARAGRQFLKAYVLGALSVIVGVSLIGIMLMDPASTEGVQVFIVGIGIVSFGGKKALSMYSGAQGLLYKAALKE